MNTGEIIIGLSGFLLGAINVLTLWNVSLARHQAELDKRKLEAKDLWV